MAGKIKTCPECGTVFDCGSGTNGECWCSRLPPILPPEPSAGCLCYKCLKRKIKREIEKYVNDVKSGKRENVAMYLPRHPLVEGLDYYVENGYRVLTEWYLLKRGYCCGNGCRHCPY